MVHDRSSFTLRHQRCVDLGRRSRNRRLGLDVILDQTSDRRRKLCAHTLPVGNAVHFDAQTFFGTGGYRIIKTDTFDKTTIAPVT